MPVPFTVVNLCLCKWSHDVWLNHMSSSGVLLAYSVAMCARRKPPEHHPAMLALGHALVHVLPLTVQERPAKPLPTREAYGRALMCLVLLWAWNLDAKRPRAYGFHKHPAQWRWALVAYAIGVLASAKTATYCSP